MWNFIIPLIGMAASALSGKQNADAVDKATAATSLSAQQQLDYLKSARDLSSKTLGKYSAEGDAARAKMLAFLGLGGDAVKYGVGTVSGNSVPETGLGGMTPAGPKKSSIPSLSGALFNTDESPSVYGRYFEGADGGISEGQHALNGGSSVGAQLTTGLTKWTAEKLGLKAPAEVLGRALGFEKKATGPGDQFGDGEDNATRAGKFDYEGYANASDPDGTVGLKKAFASLSDKDRSFIAQKYGFSGGGDPTKLTLGEFTQWWAERTEDGKAAMERGDFKTVDQANKDNAADPAKQNAAAIAAGADPTMTADEAQEAAWAEYQKTPWAKIGASEATKAKDEYLARAGAGAGALNGRVVRGTAEVADEAEQRNFGTYFGALGGVADTGFNADSGIASSGQVFANSAANVSAASGSALANAEIAKGKAQADTLDDLASWVGWGMGSNGAGGTTARSGGAGLPAYMTTGLGGNASSGGGTPVTSRIR